MRKPRGFTLVELVVVIAIVAILIGLMLPAVQAAREAARKKQCMNNVRQMAVAFLRHESAHRFFPSGGWGYRWVGEPDAGYDANQPGGWVYNILAYMEYGDVRELGSGLADDEAREEALMKLVTTPIPLLNCPSKRPLELYPMSDRNPFLAYNLTSCSSINQCHVFRSDYRVNGGSLDITEDPGPRLVPNLPRSRWKSQYASWTKKSGDQNGICFAKSTVRVADITDGAAHTAMIGEKYLDPNHYEDGVSHADDQCAYTGFDRDLVGFTGKTYGVRRPLADSPGVDIPFYFGSAHPDGLNMAFCDGSMRFIDYRIDGQVFLKFGGRDDE
jgi:prepilin-type N-terminal cleavage/methylation domain-containing protein/prepilin-type processing-associated H-X9-DG protein